MRFSEVSFGRQLLIVVVTLAIVGAVYWAAAALVAVTPLWLDIAMAVGLVGFGLWAAGNDRRKGLPPIKRPRWSWRLFLLSFIPLAAALAVLFVINAETFNARLVIAVLVVAAAVLGIAFYKLRHRAERGGY